MGFFFFGLYPTGVESESGDKMQVQIRGNCLSPVEAASFQEIFYAARDRFDLQPGATSETGLETCIDPGDPLARGRAFSKGGNA